MQIKNLIYRLLIMLLAVTLWGCNFGSTSASDSSNSGQATSLSADPTQFVTLDTAHGSIAANSVNNSRYPSIVLSFVKPLNMATVTKDNIKLIRVNDGSAVILGDFIASNSLNGLVISPAAQLESNTQYQILVTTAVKTYDGSSLSEDFSADFTTGVALQPTVALLDPAETNIGTMPLMQIIFSESDMKNVVPNYSVMFYVANDGVLSPLQITTTAKANGRIFTINRYPQDKALTVGKEYYIVVGTSITDSSGVRLLEQKQFKLVVTSSSNLSVTMVSPANAQENVSINSLVELAFNRAVNNAENNLLLHKSTPDGELITAEVSTLNRQNFVLKPSTNLPANTPIYVEVASGIFDDSGATVTPTSFNFKTADSVIPATFSVLLTSPNLQVPVSISTVFVLEFNEAATNVNSSTVQLATTTGTTVAVDVVQYSSEKYVVIPKSFLSYGTAYTLALSNQISSEQGSPLAATQFNFTTEVDKYAPQAKILDLTGESYLSPRTNPSSLVVEFSETVKNVTSANVKIILASSCAKGGKTISNGVIENVSEQGSSHPRYKIGATQLVTNAHYRLCLTNITDTANNKIATTDLGFNTDFIKATLESAMNYHSGSVIDYSNSSVSAVESQSGMLVVAGGMVDGAQQTNTYFLSAYLHNQLLFTPVIFNNSDSGKTYHINKVLIDSSKKKIYLIGYTYTSDPEHSVIYLARYDYSGKLEWTYKSAPNSDNFHTDYRGYYQAHGGFVDKSGNLYVVGGTNTENNDIDSFVIKFDASGNVKDYNHFYPTDDNFCSANAAIAYDDSSFYMVGTTQKYIQGAKAATTKTDKDYEGFLIHVRYSDLEQISAIQFGEDGHGDSGQVNLLDVTTVKVGSCPYLAMAGLTNYQFSKANGSYKYANGTITDALLIYYPLDNACSAVSLYDEFGSASGSTKATAIAYSPIKQTVALAGVTSGALSGFTKASPKDHYEGFIAIKDINSSSDGVSYPASMQQYYPGDWYQYGATSDRSLQAIGFDSYNHLFMSGDYLNTGSVVKYYISEMNQF